MVSDTVLIALIISVVVVILLVLFRNSLSRFLFKANREGVEAELETHQAQSGGTEQSAPAGTLPEPQPRASTNISGNKLFGRKNKVEVAREEVNVSDNILAGEKQEISVPAADQPKKKGKKK